jgi:hypothetical protein
VLIYDALGFTPPVFGHMSLILAPDKSKLSKRHGATSVGEFKQQVGPRWPATATRGCHTSLGWTALERRVACAAAAATLRPRASPPSAPPLMQGFLAPAMVNYLSLLGWNDGTEKEIYTVEELQGAFNLERITKVGGGPAAARAPAPAAAGPPMLPARGALTPPPHTAPTVPAPPCPPPPPPCSPPPCLTASSCRG